MRKCLPARVISTGWAVTILCLALAMPAAHGEPPPPEISIPAPAQEPTRGPDVTAASDLESLEKELGRKLEEAKVLRDRLAAETSDHPDEISPGPDESAQYQWLAESLVYLYQIQLETIPDLRDAQQALATARSREQSWVKFEQPPPYSILMLDDLRETAQAARGKLAAYESSLAQLQRQIVRVEKEAEQDKAAARLAAETLEKASAPAEKTRAKVELDLAQMRERLSGNRLAWINLDARLTKVRLETARAEILLMTRQIAAAGPQTAFTEEDLAKVKAKLEQNQEKIEREQQAAMVEHDRWIRERDKTQRMLERQAATPAPQGAAEPAEPDILNARLQAAKRWIETLRFRTYALQTSLTLTGQMSDLWAQRYVLANSEDPEKRQEALTAIKLSLDRLRPLESYLYGELDLVRADELRQTTKVDKLVGSSQAMREIEQSILEAYRAKRENLERVQLFLHRSAQALQRWIEDYETGLQARGINERLHERLAQATEIGRQIWRFELFTVDDTVEIDGKPTTVTRGVTFGKSIGAICLLLVGYWISAAFSRRVQRLLENRYNIDTPQAHVFRRWVLSICTLILLVIILNFVRIPLTAFAFLGGALAIGVGFGTQTLLKNLISGVMVLLERKIKVGDIVEVDGVVGTVTEIDIRSSTVRGFDGVETMVPNATFVENKVTNWTYSTPRVRRAVRVGVAYGSPVRRVADVLGECVSRHGLILHDPAPNVWFEDFGDNALVFGVYYWLELRPQVNSNQVASDLRFMIEKRFGEEGIAVAFPQRDIHISSVRPLQVEVVASKATENEESARSPVSKLRAR